jgi:predicted kinase
LPTTVVAVTGLPGSGKTTLARHLAVDLGWPLITKDTIKEALGDALGIRGEEQSRRLSGASYRVLYALAADVPREVIVESNFRADSVPAVRALSQAPPVELFCSCPVEVAVDRYNSRARHPVHHTPVVTPGLLLTLGTAEPVGFGGPIITVDTTTAIDLPCVAAQVRQAALLTGR